MTKQPPLHRTAVDLGTLLGFREGTDPAEWQRIRAVQLATDADVGVVAHHVAQLALDVITRPEASRYPHSMYLLGFRAGWVFDQPFQNLPVTMPDPGQWPEVGGEAAELSAAEQAELNRLCLEILKESKR